jgi:uncharacterized protein
LKTVGHVTSLWRYPVKSMRGEPLLDAFAAYSGIYGDRFYAFFSEGCNKGFPYFTGREKESMLLYTPAYRHADRMAAPPNLADANALSPGLTCVYPEGEEMMVDVRTPTGETWAINDPQLLTSLQEGLPERHVLKLGRSHRSMTDCRPISLLSMHTVEQLSKEFGSAIDPRRFRANLYLDLLAKSGFSENEFVGRTLRIGTSATIQVLDRDTRCKMITLDPDTGQANPEIMRHVARAHESKVGIYAAVLVEGIVKTGDEIALLD